jgi:mono/diheme cytochrome c family protein
MKKALAILGLGFVALAALFFAPKFIKPGQPEAPGRTLSAASLVPVEPPTDYGWVDRNSGVARIPISRAMDIVGEKGLPWGKMKEEPIPVITSTAAPSGTADEKKPAGPALDPAIVQIGQALFTMYRCGGCHVAGSTFPPLNGKYGTRVNLEGGDTALFDDAYIIESLITPNLKIAAGYKAQMPPYKDRITDAEMKQIIVYIRSLK